MESSSTVYEDLTRADLVAIHLRDLFRAARREDAYIPLYMLAELIANSFDTDERRLLAEYLLRYDLLLRHDLGETDAGDAA